MQDKLYKLDNLTFEQIACAVLDINNADESPQVYTSYITQLCNAAESGQLEGATKVPKWQLPTLLYTTRDGNNTKNNITSELEYNSRSKMPKEKFINYLNTNGQNVPTCLIKGVNVSKLSEDVSEEVAGLKAENQRLRAELATAKKSYEAEVLKPTHHVTFGGVCFLLAKYGIINSKAAFNSPGFSSDRPKPNASAISKAIKELASVMVDVKVSDAGGADKGFKDSERRQGISAACQEFEGYISEAETVFTQAINENNKKQKV